MTAGAACLQAGPGLAAGRSRPSPEKGGRRLPMVTGGAQRRVHAVGLSAGRCGVPVGLARPNKKSVLCTPAQRGSLPSAGCGSGETHKKGVRSPVGE